MQISGRTAQQRLAEAVRTRRRDLGLRQEDVSAGGGPSKATLYQVENCAADAYSDATIARLERVLRWAPGSVEAVVRGGAPTPLPGVELADDDDPVEVVYKGYRFRMYPRPGASAEEQARAQRAVLDAVLERIDELGLGGASPDAGRG